MGAEQFLKEDGVYHYPNLSTALSYAEQVPEDAFFVIDEKDDMDFIRMYQKYVDSRS